MFNEAQARSLSLPRDAGLYTVAITVLGSYCTCAVDMAALISNISVMFVWWLRAVCVFGAGLVSMLRAVKSSSFKFEKKKTPR